MLNLPIKQHTEAPLRLLALLPVLYAAGVSEKGETVTNIAGPEADVRPYRAEDRAAVEDICYRTGYMGDSAEHFWRHKRSFVNTWTSYYIDQEPESLYVATKDGTVVGYLTGCLKSLFERFLKKCELLLIETHERTELSKGHVVEPLHGGLGQCRQAGKELVAG